MIYPEFEQFESFVDPLNPYCNAYKTKEGHIFYVEPGFYSGMQGFKEKREERYQDLLNGIFDVIKKNEKVPENKDFYCYTTKIMNVYPKFLSHIEMLRKGIVNKDFSYLDEIELLKNTYNYLKLNY